MNEAKKVFFISYTNTETDGIAYDRQWAEWIAGTLEQQENYKCIIQAWDFHAGGDWVSFMHNAIINSDATIAVLSQNYLDSESCQAELFATFVKDPNGAKRSLIPVRVSKVKQESLGLFASRIYIDMVGITDEAKSEKLLLDKLNPTRPSTRPPFPGGGMEKLQDDSKTPKAPFPNQLPKLPTNNLPLGRNKFFVGRENVFDKIREGFKNGDNLSLSQSQTIVGMGGLGKTQTALEYAHRDAAKYNLIWWVQAETEIDVINAYRRFAIKMNLINRDEQDNELIIEKVLEWMQDNDRWLFIYDNVEDISTVEPTWWPKANSGNILITTRNEQDGFEEIDIDVFDEDEAGDFLEKRTEIKDCKDKALTLAERLGFLPLALEQAAVYIKINKISFDRYLSMLEKRGISLLDKKSAKNYPKTLDATMDISIDKINQESAIQLLYLCSYMAAKDIDESLFNKHPEFLPAPLSEVITDEDEMIDVWQELTQYSLLKKQDDGKGYTMHRLLQEVVRNKIKNDQQWAVCCLNIFVKTYNFIYGDVASHNNFMKLTPHVEAFLNASTLIWAEDGQQRRRAFLYNMGGAGLFELGYDNRALRWFKKALKIREKVLGEHPSTANTYNNIGEIYRTMGDYNEALELFYKALKIKEEMLGVEHPSTAITYNNIAEMHRMQGEYNKALELHHKTLDIFKKVLAIEHPDIATTYNNIAGVYCEQSDYNRALMWYNKSLAVNEKVSGVEHPDTATTYNNIAEVYHKQGYHNNALKLYFKALVIFEKVLGVKHPSTIIVYNNIAIAYEDMGNNEKAAEYYRKAGVDSPS